MGVHLMTKASDRSSHPFHGDLRMRAVTSELMAIGARNLIQIFLVPVRNTSAAQALRLCMYCICCSGILACDLSVAGTNDEELMMSRAAAGRLAVRLEPPPHGASYRIDGERGREDLTGVYELRADSCYQWGDRYPNGYLVSKLPDFSLMPDEPLILEVRDTVVGTEQRYWFQVQSGRATPQRSFSISAHSRGDSALCDRCVVYHDFRSAGNLGGHGGFFYTLGRDQAGALYYTMTLESRRSILGIDRRRLRRMQCTFAEAA
jgi:hypothetical protein